MPIGRQAGPMAQVLAEAIPGQGVRREVAAISPRAVAVAAGRRVRPRDLLIARVAGMES